MDRRQRPVLNKDRGEGRRNELWRHFFPWGLRGGAMAEPGGESSKRLVAPECDSRAACGGGSSAHPAAKC